MSKLKRALSPARHSGQLELEMASSRGRWASPQRTVVWTEPKAKAKVAVVYYLCRDGRLDHPHLMEVTLSSPARGLYLRDVIARLNTLRGAAVADLYSWSSKRSYKNGYVWHDLAHDDLIHPAHAGEYVLKGSLLLPLPPPLPPPSSSATSSAARRNKWSSFDLAEYKVAVRSAAELSAPTHTDDTTTTELSIEEISPPPSSSSPGTLTLETLINNDAGRAAATATTVTKSERERVADSSRDTVGVIAGGRMRASSMLMQLISCGSITVKDGKLASGRGRPDVCANKEAEGLSSGGMERDYFSGSLIETKKTSQRGGAGDLRRSSSYNADRAVN